MAGMDMTGFRVIPSGMTLMVPADMPWRAMEFIFVFAMWTVMMVGMMTPSAAPIILLYARVGRQIQAHGRPLAATVWFATGYFLVWIAFALLATLVQWAFERTVLLDFTMATTNTVVGGLLFVAAGSYQWTRLKDVCLTQCQKPFAFLMRQGGFRGDATRCSSWRVLCRLLLGTDGAIAGGRRDERALDCPARATHSSGEGRSLRPSDRSRCWHGPHRGRCVVVFNGNVLTVTPGAIIAFKKIRQKAVAA
jgi:hypothetical protein